MMTRCFAIHPLAGAVTISANTALAKAIKSGTLAETNAIPAPRARILQRQAS
ncbi:MAG: hypothetical protein WBM09_08520 [Gallionella sp.]